MEFGTALQAAAATLGRRVLVPVLLFGLQRKVLPHLSVGMMWPQGQQFGFVLHVLPGWESFLTAVGFQRL